MSDRKNLIWNAIAAAICAINGVIITAVVSRVNGIEIAGMFTIAFAMANLLSNIGKYGMKKYQVTQGNGRYTFSTFLYSRFVTVVLMIIAVLGYVCLKMKVENMQTQKVIIILGVSSWYFLEALEDVFAGEYQAKGRLDVGSKILILRWIVILIVFVFCDYVCTLEKALFMSNLFGIIIEILSISATYHKYIGRAGSVQMKQVMQVLRICLPLSVSGFLYFYTTNLSKYAIETYSTDTAQAIYGYISLPVFAISVLNSIIYQPELTYYAAEWKQDRQAFSRRMKRQLLRIAGIGGMAIICAYFCGVPILSIIYHVNLNEQRSNILMVILGGVLLAIGGFIETMLTVIGEQKKAMYGYLVVCLLGKFIVDNMVKKYELDGGVIGYVCTMTMYVLFFGGMYLRVRFKNEQM
ncbi:MAG: lipopolysaccharide biosynthesis protein [Lachnospiraceae bacterium]